MYRKLFGETLIYGFGNVIVRIFPFIVSPFITKRFDPDAYAPFVDFYSAAGIIIVLLSHGMETAFFRFSQKENNTEKLTSTATLSVVGLSVLFMVFSFIFRDSLAVSFRTPDQVNYLIIMMLVLGIDGLCAMPFVILRKTGRPLKFSIVKIVSGIGNFLLVLFFIVWLPKFGDRGVLGLCYDHDFGIGYIFLANLISSAVALLLLIKEFQLVKISNFSIPLWKKMISYSWPVTLAGLAGVINESLDRQFLKYLLPVGESDVQMSIYGAAYKLVTFLLLFRQSYLLGIEPFLFSHSKNKNANDSYILLMNLFVIANCLILLALVGNLDWIGKLFLQNPAYYSGLGVVPIILIASVFFGIYLNLSIWYKLSDRTIFGAYISVVGALITILINLFFIPKYGYWASAWATLFSYISMLLISYALSRRYHPIPYHSGKILFYLLVSIAFSTISYYVFPGNIFLGNLFLFVFLVIVLFLEKKTLKVVLKH